MQKKGKAIIFSAPSGAGKTTIVHKLLMEIPSLAFSISACSRPPRPMEEDSKDYYFLSIEDFKSKIASNSFIEWEEVYTDHFYGTLKSEVERIWNDGKTVIFDVDVFGGINLKKYFGDNAISIFVMPPSIAELDKRLHNRQTETEEKIQTRLAKAEKEIDLNKQFDVVIVNDKLENAVKEAKNLVIKFIQEK